MRSGAALIDKKGFFLFIIYLLISIPIVCGWSDTITSASPLKDGDTMVSSSGLFEMGFFSAGNSKNRYIGIWYKNIPTKTVVWVANREAPVSDKLGMFKVMNSGAITIVNGKNTILWSSNTSRTTQSPISQLLDSGNLVVKDKSDGRPENFLWQSFDYPGDTLLPDMKIGKELLTGHENYITSWKSDDDPSPGDFTFGCDLHGYPHQVIKKGQNALNGKKMPTMCNLL